MTARLDPSFERIARRLTTLELLAPGAGDGSLFVGAYSEQGLRRVLDEYGLAAKLAEQKLGDFVLDVVQEDPFRQRLEIMLPDKTPIMDLRLHLTDVALPKMEEQRASVVVVEWLLMQNPRFPFSRNKPRLPGQKHPGTGLGSAVAQLLMLMCRRIGREGLLVVPERFHLAELYARGGWLAPDDHADRDLDDVKAATKKLTFAQRAWAVERGFVKDDTGAAYVYRPEERALPVSERMQKALSPGGFLRLDRVERLLTPRRPFTVDVAAFKDSLVADPVEGMDPGDVVE